MKYFASVLLIIITLVLSTCQYQEKPDDTIFVRVDTVYITDTLLDTRLDTIQVTKEISLPDKYDVYVIAQTFIDSQFTGELHFYSEYENSRIEAAGDNIYKTEIMVQWHDGITAIQTIVFMNLKYFGGNPRDSKNWVRTFFGQSPRCQFSAPCGW